MKQPTPKVDRGTDYERPITPYFIDAAQQASDNVEMFVFCDRHFGTCYDDSNHWEIDEACTIPAMSFYKALANLEAGKEISLQIQADVVKTDSAWGADCEYPHDIVTHQEVQILLRIGISEDMKTVTLKLLRQEADVFMPYAQLQQAENASVTSPKDNEEYSTED